MKIKEINISLGFVLMCFILFIFNIYLGIRFGQIHFFLTLFIVSIILFILFELLGTCFNELLETDERSKQ